MVNLYEKKYSPKLTYEFYDMSSAKVFILSGLNSRKCRPIRVLAVYFRGLVAQE
jgi:hypothetical protein